MRLFKSVTPIVRRIEDKLLSSLNGKRVDEFLDNLALIVGAGTPSPAVGNGHYTGHDARK